MCEKKRERDKTCPPFDMAGLDCDPYLMNEADPAKSNALKSSLWEIMVVERIIAVQHHVLFFFRR